MVKLKLLGDKRPILLLKICCLLYTHIPGSSRHLDEIQGPFLGWERYLELRGRMMTVELEPHWGSYRNILKTCRVQERVFIFFFSFKGSNCPLVGYLNDSLIFIFYFFLKQPTRYSHFPDVFLFFLSIHTLQPHWWWLDLVCVVEWFSFCWLFLDLICEERSVNLDLAMTYFDYRV